MVRKANQKENIKMQLEMLDVEYELSTNCTPNFIQNTDNVITLVIRVPKTNHVFFYINFD